MPTDPLGLFLVVFTTIVVVLIGILAWKNRCTCKPCVNHQLWGGRYYDRFCTECQGGPRPGLVLNPDCPRHGTSKSPES